MRSWRCSESGVADVSDYMVIAGQERRMGNIIPTADTKPKLAAPKLKTYGDTRDTPMFRREDWPAKIAKLSQGPKHRFRPPRHDQNGIGCCNASALCAAFEHTRKRQGLPPKKFSAGFVYGQINGGVDQGSLLEDALALGQKSGLCTVDKVPYLDWHSRPAAAVAEAKENLILEAFLAPTFDHLMSGVMAGFAGIDGILWYENYNPDSEGWVPRKGQGQPGGHAIYVYKPAMRTGKGGTNYFGVWKQGSWSGYAEQFGGCAVLPEDAHQGPVGGWYLIRLVTDEGGVVPQER